MDFDFLIEDITLVHKAFYPVGYEHHAYKKRRNVAGLVYCITGRLLFKFPHEKVYLNPGEMIFLSENSSYICKSVGDEVFFHITENFKLLEKCTPTNEKMDRVLSGNEYYIFRADTLETKALYENMWRIWQQKRYGYKLKAKSITYDLLYRYFFSLSQDSKDDYEIMVEPALKALDLKYMTDISVLELANICNMSESYFRRIFKKVYGLSPMEYKIHCRILKAKDMLLTYDFDMNQIATAVGFDDANYFSRIFKKKTGITPSEFKKTN